MNNHDEVLLTRYPIATSCMSIGERELDKRKAERKRELYREFQLKGLRATELAFHLVSEVDGIYLVVFLVRSHQSNLSFLKESSKDHDLFRMEVDRIKEVQTDLPELYQIALKADIAKPAKNGEGNVIWRREQLSANRKTDHIWIPSKPEGERFEYMPPSTTMSHAMGVDLRVKVIGIFKRDCRIVIQKVLTKGVELPLNLIEHSRKVYRRDKALGEMAGLALVCSMENGISLDVSAQIEFSWVDQSVERITLTGMPIPTAQVLPWKGVSSSQLLAGSEEIQKMQRLDRVN